MLGQMDVKYPFFFIKEKSVDKFLKAIASTPRYSDWYKVWTKWGHHMFLKPNQNVVSFQPDFTSTAWRIPNLFYFMNTRPHLSLSNYTGTNLNRPI